MNGEGKALNLAKVRWVLWILTGVAASLWATIYFGMSPNQWSPAISTDKKPSIAAPFVLTNQNGQEFTQSNILGKPTLIFFGFLSCPDVCPTTLNDISSWLDALGTDADRLNTIYVSVDPARDTPTRMADYLASFDRRIVGLTGREEELQKLTKSLGVFYAKENTSEGDYTMNHTASVLLLDKNGTLERTIDYHEKRSIAVQKIRLSLRR